MLEEDELVILQVAELVAAEVVPYLEVGLRRDESGGVEEGEEMLRLAEREETESVGLQALPIRRVAAQDEVGVDLGVAPLTCR